MGVTRIDPRCELPRIPHFESDKGVAPPVCSTRQERAYLPSLTARSRRSAVPRYLYTQVGALQTLLKGVTRTTVNGYATLRFSGLNLQVVNGSGSESTLNGLGNLIVGYANDAGFSRTGSHNLITGNFGGWASYGGLLAGSNNQITGGYASVSG